VKTLVRVPTHTLLAAAVVAQFLAGSLMPARVAGAPRTAEVRQHQGRPHLFVDGRLTLPHFYALTHAYGARWSWEEVPQRNLKNFADAGLRLFQLDLYFEDIWRSPEAPLDMDKACRQVRGLLDVCPEAGVVLRIHVNAPFWWNEANRGECVAFADGPVDTRTYGPPFNNEDGDVDRPLRASLASLKWRTEAGARLVEFCQRLAAAPEGDAVIGMHVSGGVYGEWHNWGFIDHDPDTSGPMTEYFRGWLARTYPSDQALQQAWADATYTRADATVPDLAERERTTDGIFRDPRREQRVIDYFRAQHEVVAEDIESFTGLVKKTWPRPLIVGVFYGYLHMTFCRQAAGGHLAIERILNCASIDYLSAPQSYWGDTQQLGGSGNSRGIVESTLLHGKLWLDELDNGHLQRKNVADPARSSGRFDPQYLPVLQRSALLPMMRGAGLWYYDFGPRESFGWWDDPTYLRSIADVHGLLAERLGRESEPVADVLYVWDQESFYFVKNRYTAVAYSLLDQAVEEALRSGAVGDHVYLFDLPRVELRRYRAIVFMNVYVMTAAQRDFICREVARDGRTLVWNFLPGYTDSTRNSLEFVRELTSFGLARRAAVKDPQVSPADGGPATGFDGVVDPFVVIDDGAAEILARLGATGEAVVGRKRLDDAVSVYSTLPLRGSSMYRKVFREAGCHIYDESGDFTYVGAGMLMVHSRDGGRRELRLKNGTRITIEMPPASTRVIDAETGDLLLQEHAQLSSTATFPAPP
jgi:hypothetical protein